MLHKAWNSKGEMPYYFPRSSIKYQGHRVQNITDFDPNWAFPDYRPVAAFKPLRFALFGVIHQISRSQGLKNRRFKSNLSKITRPVAAIKSLRFALLVFLFWYIFSCDQAALQMVFSVCLSVCSSHLFDYVPIIVSSWNFQELLPMTKVRSVQKVKVRGQRSRSQRSQPNLTVSGL